MAERTTSEVLARTKTQINKLKEDLNNALEQGENKVSTTQCKLFQGEYDPITVTALKGQGSQKDVTSSDGEVATSAFPPTFNPQVSVGRTNLTPSPKPEDFGAIVISTTDASNGIQSKEVFTTIADSGTIYVSKDNNITVKLSNIVGEGIDSTTNLKYLIAQYPLEASSNIMIPSGSSLAIDLATNTATVTGPSGSFIIVPYGIPGLKYDMEGGATFTLTPRRNTFYTLPSKIATYSKSNQAFNLYKDHFPTAPSGTFNMAIYTAATLDETGTVVPNITIPTTGKFPSDEKMFFIDARLKLNKDNVDTNKEYVFTSVQSQSFYDSTESSTLKIALSGHDEQQEIKTTLKLTPSDDNGVSVLLELDQTYKLTDTNKNRFNNNLFYKQSLSLWLLMIPESTQTTEEDNLQNTTE